MVPRNSNIKVIVVKYAGIWGTKLPDSQVPLSNYPAGIRNHLCPDG